ncbi:MAG: YitT family protein [Mycoplasmatota bacterium]
MLKKKKADNIVSLIYKKDRLIRTAQFLLGVFLVAVSFNLFILPMQIVYGVSGISVILEHLYGLTPSIVIFIGSIILLLMSLILLGKKKTANSVIGSILYPIFVQLTINISNYIDVPYDDPIVMTLFGAVISGLGLGLIFKTGFTTGGTDILNQIVSKYFKMSIGNAMFFTDGLIIVSGVFIFGWTQLMYSLITLYIISVMTDRVILGISQSKMFHIITEHETSVKSFIMNDLNHGVTVLEGKGAFTGNRQKVLMCIIPTKEYFIVKEGLNKIDPDAFFVVSDSYEVSGGA